MLSIAAWEGFVPRAAVAADATFVGALALAVEEEGVRRLALNEETRAKLLQLIDRREQEALNLVLSLRDLPPAERAARLAPFVQESEKMGMELLTLEQRNVLDQMRTARAGLASLGEANVAQVLNLSAEQRAAVQRLLEQRAEILKVGKSDQQRDAYNRIESELAAVLSPEQRAGWERMAGLAQGTVPAPSAPEAEKTPPPAAPEATGDAGSHDRSGRRDAGPRNPGDLQFSRDAGRSGTARGHRVSRHCTAGCDCRQRDGAAGASHRVTTSSCASISAISRGRTSWSGLRLKRISRCKWTRLLPVPSITATTEPIRRRKPSIC